MKVKKIVLLMAVAFAAVPVSMGAQAIAVGADGSMQQEKPAPVIAPENQASPEQVAKLFDVMRIKQQMQSMKSMVSGMVQQQVHSAMKQSEAELPAGSNLTPEKREKMQQVINKYVSKSMDLYPADEMLADMTTIYQKHLSKDDVEGLIAFYGSPAGQHLLDAQPVIAQEYMPMVMGKVGQRSQTMMREMMREVAEVAPQTKPAAKPAAKAGPAKTTPK
ncbi:DUF2059 domain-containing protein [Occallatibacter savannae]|uniref:DUF2059 domain-containing protein n=1 Tax=Occallatibacter savannae TaxID=1002691 RepID=UPI000D68D60A|nr:DUF2059 domain-containing protein [Occallatibacter savannae]